MPSYLSRNLLDQARADVDATASAQTAANEPPAFDFGGLASRLASSFTGDTDTQQPPPAAPPTPPQPSPSGFDFGRMASRLASSFLPDTSPRETQTIDIPGSGGPMAAGYAPARPPADPSAPLGTGGPQGAGSPRPAPLGQGTAGPGMVVAPSGVRNAQVTGGDKASFLATAGPIAAAVEQETGIPAKLSLAISANETGWGNPKYVLNGAYHGIQAQAGEQGAGYTDVTAAGTPYQARLKAFATPYDAFRGFADFLNNNPRYAPALARYKQTGDVNQLAADIKAAGYAEDPNYVGKITAIMGGIPDIAAPAPRPAGPQPPPTAGEPGGPPLTTQAPAYAPGSYTPNQINAAQAEGLDYETALAVCGPAAAIAFARKTGRNPTMQEALGLAKQVGWTVGAGMAGPTSERQLLSSMGIASRLVDGAPDWAAVAADVQRGNPVIVSTPGHYFVAEQYDPATGKFNFGNSAAILKASGGQTWFTPQEMASLGMGAPRGSLFMDNPATPSPSVVAGSSRESAPRTGPDVQAMSYRLPLATAGPDTVDAPESPRAPSTATNNAPMASDTAGAFQDDYTQAGWNPAPTGAPLVSGAPTLSGPGPELPPPAQAIVPRNRGNEDATAYPPQPAGIDWGQGAANLTGTVGQAVSNVVSPVVSGISNAVGTARGVVNQAADIAESAAPVGPFPHVLGQATRFIANLEPGPVSYLNAQDQLDAIDQQASDWIRQQGRQPSTLVPSRDPAWRQANPELAQQYDEIQAQQGLLIGGTVGAGGETPHGPTEGAPRPGGRPAPRPTGETPTAQPSAIEQAHAGLDAAEAQGIDVAAARAALPERPTPAESVAPQPTEGGPQPGRVRGAGSYDPATTSPEAADLVRQERATYDANERGRIPRAETARRAEQTLALEPGTIERLQQETLAADPGAAPAEGGALRLAAYGDAEAAIEAQRRFDAATAELHDHIASGGTPETAPEELKQRLAEATADLADLRQRLSTSARASSAHGTAAARVLAERQNTVSARGAYQLAEQGRQLAKDTENAATAAKKAAETGVVDEASAGRLRTARRRLAESVSEKSQQRAADVEERMGAVERQAERARSQSRQRRGEGQAPQGEAPARPPAAETLEERLGRLKREHGYAEDRGDTARASDLQSQVDATLEEMRARAAEEAQKIANQTKKPLTPEEAQRAVDRAIGRRASARINREARARASGQAEGQFLSQFDRDLGKKIDAALAKDAKLQAQAQVNDLAKDARDWHQRSLGDPANEAFRREEQAALKKLEEHSTLGKATADDLAQRFEVNRSESAFKFRSDMEKRIADAERERTAADQKQNLKDLRTEARTWLDRAIKEPDNPHIEEQFQQAAENLAKHSPQSGQHALDLIGKLADAKDEAAFKLHAGVEQRIADQARREAAATAREVEASRIRGVVAQIDEVLANPNAPGAAERLQQLHADLTEISQKGFEKSSDLRRRLHEKNLLKAGMSKGADLDALVSALAHVDPNDPASIRPVLQAISRPTLMGILREMQYVNMLSSPITHGVNATSSAMQIAGRLLVNNPLEFIGSRGASSGTGAAFEGAARGVRRGGELARTVMRTGMNPDALERAIETGSVGNVSRELLTEKFGKLGAALHAVSTRPLEAMDAMLGHVMYSSVVAQEAQRLADRMLAEGAAEVKGMSRQAAAEYIQSHVWDYPEIIRKAGKIQDYTLLKSHDVGQGIGGRLERGLRQFVNTRYAPENPTWQDHAISAMFDIGLPFFNVPLNFTKQGLERTFGAPVQAAKFAGALGAERAAGTAAERAAARTTQGEAFAKAGISAGILTTGISLALNDSLTGDGPTDPGKRAVWLENHQPHSVRVPGTNQWISYDGTPVAVPFAAVAGAAENLQEAGAAPGNQQLSPSDMLVRGGLGAAKGTAKGVLSQSFLQGIADQYNLIANPTESGLARSIAGTASRGVPLGGMVSWLARMTDDVQRDTGRARTGSDIPTNVAAQLAGRIPGLREQLSPRLGAYGENVRNPQYGALGALPYYRGPAQNQNDPLTQHLEASNVGAVLPPPSMPISLGAGSHQSVDIPLTAEEQRSYQQKAGRAFRQLLDDNPNAQTMSQAGLLQIRAAARQIAEQQVQAEIGADEIRRRVQQGMQKAG